MNFTLSIGWWVIPLLVTLLSISAAWYSTEDLQDGDIGGWYIPDFGTPLLNLMKWGVALIISLLAWLIWALIF